MPVNTQSGKIYSGAAGGAAGLERAHSNAPAYPNTNRQTITEAMTPTVSAISPAGSA